MPTVTELITLLEALQEAHGDVPVHVVTADDTWRDPAPTVQTAGSTPQIEF